MDTIIERLCMVSPDQTAVRAEAAIAALSAQDDRAGWLPLCEQFNMPRVTARRLWAVAQAGGDPRPLLAAWLDQIGVTESLLPKQGQPA